LQAALLLLGDPEASKWEAAREAGYFQQQERQSRFMPPGRRGSQATATNAEASTRRSIRSSLYAPPSPPSPPEDPNAYRFLQLEVLTVRSGQSGYKACIKELWFYERGEPILDQQVISKPPNRPWIVQFPTPRRVDSYTLVVGDDEDLVPVEFTLLASSDGHVWREVSGMNDDDIRPKSVLRIPLGSRRHREDMIRVLVERAQGLIHDEISKHQGTSDPYCTIWIDGKPETKVHTKVIQDTLNPNWQDRLELYGYERGDSLRIQVRNSNFGTSMKSSVKDTLLGTARLEGEDIARIGGWQGESLDLTPPPPKPKAVNPRLKDPPSPPGKQQAAQIWLKVQPYAQACLSKKMKAKGNSADDWLGLSVP